MSMTKSLEENNLYSDLLSIIVSQESDKIPLSVTTAKKYKMSLSEINKELQIVIKSSQVDTAIILAAEFLSKIKMSEDRVFFTNEGCVLISRVNQKTIKSSSIKLMSRIEDFINSQVRIGRVDIIQFPEINIMILAQVLEMSKVTAEELNSITENTKDNNG